MFKYVIKSMVLKIQKRTKVAPKDILRFHRKKRKNNNNKGTWTETRIRGL